MPQNTLSYYCSLCVDPLISAAQLIAGNQRKDQLQSYTFFLNRLLLSHRNCAYLPARMARLRHASYDTRARTGWNELVRRMKRGLAPNDASRIKRRFCGVF